LETKTAGKTKIHVSFSLDREKAPGILITGFKIKNKNKERKKKAGTTVSRKDSLRAGNVTQGPC